MWRWYVDGDIWYYMISGQIKYTNLTTNWVYVDNLISYKLVYEYVTVLRYDDDCMYIVDVELNESNVIYVGISTDVSVWR